MLRTREPSTIPLSFRVPVERMQQLNELAEATGRSRAFLAEQALEQYLEAQAWQVRAIQEGIEYADLPDAKFADHEAVMEWVKSWGTDNPKDLPECE